VQGAFRLAAHVAHPTKGEDHAAVLLTRLELFLRQKNLKPLHIARASEYSRQHFLRLRLGEQAPTARSIIAVVKACRAATGEPVAPEQLFERADELLRTHGSKLSALHKPDLALLDELLSHVRSGTWAEDVLATGIRTETGVRHVVLAGIAAIDAVPEAAAEVFRAAVLMTSALPLTEPELAASFSANALKGRANALRHLGRFDDALADLEVAAKLFAAARYCDDEAGQVEYTRATVLFKHERWEEALPAARTAGARFLGIGDRRRAAHAEIVEAGILFEQGDTGGAREVFHRLRGTLHVLRDKDALARVWMNLAACDIRLGHADSARHWLNRASGAFRRQGNATEFLRTRWGMGTYMVRFRGQRRGLRFLQRVERSFRELGMDADAACVGLDILELFVDSGARRETLGEQARSIVAAFVAAGMEASLASAFAHLRQIHLSPNPRAVLQDFRAAIRVSDEDPCGEYQTTRLPEAEPPGPLASADVPSR
jgi:tetratricopeptide (TPR) repeat protein